MKLSEIRTADQMRAHLRDAAALLYGGDAGEPASVAEPTREYLVCDDLDGWPVPELSPLGLLTETDATALAAALNRVADCGERFSSVRTEPFRGDER